MKYLMLVLLSFLSATAIAALQIVHGDIVKDDQQYPAVVAVYVPSETEDEVFCTGTVIAPNWVLTASHCIFDYQKKRVREAKEFLVGTGHLAAIRSHAKKVISVKQVYPYNGYDLQHDIALLQLTEPADVMPFELPSSSSAFPDLKSGTQTATVVGYGWIDCKWPKRCSENPYDPICQSSESIFDNYLHFGKDNIIQTDVSINKLIHQYYDLEQTEQRYQILYDPMTMIGATSPQGKHVSNRDSGGPLLISIKQNNNDVKYVQVGLTSWGVIPDKYINRQYIDGSPTVFVNLTEPRMLEFIKKTIKNP